MPALKQKHTLTQFNSRITFSTLIIHLLNVPLLSSYIYIILFHHDHSTHIHNSQSRRRKWPHQVPITPPSQGLYQICYISIFKKGFKHLGTHTLREDHPLPPQQCITRTMQVYLSLLTIPRIIHCHTNSLTLLKWKLTLWIVNTNKLLIPNTPNYLTKAYYEVVRDREEVMSTILSKIQSHHLK